MSQQDTDNENQAFKGLSNEQLVLIYYRLKNYYDTLNSNLDKNLITRTVKTPMGTTLGFKETTPENVEKFKNSYYYLTLTDSLEKLESVVKIIEECDDQVIKKLSILKV